MKRKRLIPFEIKTIVNGVLKITEKSLSSCSMFLGR